MILFLLCLAILMLLFGVAFKLTGVILKACLWLFILLPLGLTIGCLGLVCCCTIILIPLGVSLFKTGLRVVIPG